MALTPAAVLREPGRMELPSETQDARLIVGGAVAAALAYDTDGSLIAAAWRVLAECARRGRLSIVMPFVAQLYARSLCSGAPLPPARTGLRELRAAAAEHHAELERLLRLAEGAPEGRA